MSQKAYPTWGVLFTGTMERGAKVATASQDRRKGGPGALEGTSFCWQCNKCLHTKIICVHSSLQLQGLLPCQHMDPITAELQTPFYPTMMSHQSRAVLQVWVNIALQREATGKPNFPAVEGERKEMCRTWKRNRTVSWTFKIEIRRLMESKPASLWAVPPGCCIRPEGGKR